jgi:hypothetical protein
MWRLPRTSGYSYPRVAAIEIDVHPTGENPTNTTRTLPTPVHVRLVYASCERSPYVATLHKSSAGLDGCTAPEKKCSRLHLSARLSGLWDPLQFLSQHNHWSSALKPSTCWWQTTRLTGHISPTCDRYVQYLLVGANPSVLDQHRWGLQYWRSWLSTYHSSTFPVSCLPFPLKALPGLRLIIQQLSTDLERDQSLNLVSGSLHLTSTVTYHLSIAWANDVPPR